jgi:hypothetical protein
MPRALDRKPRVVTIRLFDDDIEYLKLTYSRGYNQIIRALVARHVRKLRVKTAENLQGEELSQEELESV